MSIFSSLFGGGASQTTATPAAQPPAQPQGNIPAAPSMEPSNNNPNAPAQVVQSAPAAEPQGLDQFNDLWKAPEQSSQSPANQPLLNVDPQKLMEAAGKVDFAKVIPQESLQAISQGGPEAMQAFASALNKVAQTVYAQNAMATSKIVEQALGNAKTAWTSELPQFIKSQNVSETLRAENPTFNHPAASPILGALQQQLTVKYPNASAQEIAGLAKTYLGQFATAVQGPQTQANQQSQDDGVDWTKFLA